MKAQLLKIAGVKSDKEFYKLFPNTPEGEKAFMKKYAKEFKKAQKANAIEKAQYGTTKLNADTNKNGIPDYLEANPALGSNQFVSGNGNIDSFYQYKKSAPYSGSMFKGNQIPQANYVNIGKPPVDMSDPQAPSFQNMNMPYNQDIGFMQQATEAKLPKDAPLGGSGGGDFLTKNAPYVNAGMDVLQGASMIKGQRNAKKQAQQDSLVTAKLAEAAESVDVDAQRQRQDYAARKRNAFMTPIVGESLFPVTGVGTNVLAKHGGEIPNAQSGRATRADSLAVFNNTVALNKHYDNLRKKGFYKTPEKRDLSWLKSPYQTEPLEKNLDLEKLKKETLKYYRDAYVRDYSTTGDLEDFKRTYPNKTEEDYKKGLAKSLKETKSGNKNKYYYKDIYPSQIDPLAPSTLIDTRIIPQYQLNYRAKNNRKPPAGGTITGMYGYDLLAVKPFDLLTDAEKKTRVEKYGTDGVPKSYLNKNKPNTNIKPIVDPKKKPIVNPTKLNVEGLQPMGVGLQDVDNGFETNLDIPTPVQRQPKYYDIHDVNNQYGGGDTQYRVDSLDELRELPKEQWDRKITPHYQMGGEIQNTYDPYDIYDDGGYEPLNDADKVKTYQMGGQSAGDIAGQFEPFATNLSNTYINQGGQADAGSMIGGGIGGAAGMAFGGPLGAAIGKFAGSTIGGLIDTTDRDIKKFQNESQRNIGRLTGQAFGKSIQAQNASYMEDGGYVSNDWTPQVIAKFGDHSAEDYYNYAHEYDTLRAGGHVKSEHYTPVSARGLETAALGGSVKTLWGGEVRPISHNPYMPNSGETVNFYGQSHDDGGIGVKYGEGGEAEQGEEANVEVERGEPSFEMIDPKTGKPTLNVLGDRKVHASFAKQLGDPELVKLAKQYDGKKFKNIGLELSKKENKYTSLIDKATKELNELTPKNQFDKLKLNALEKNIEGAHLGLKQIADTKMTLTHFQNAINDTADELGESLGKDISSSNLNKGKVMFGKDKGQIAKYGAAIERAQTGSVVKGRGKKWDYSKIGPQQTNPNWKSEKDYYGNWVPKLDKAFENKSTAKQLLEYAKRHPGEEGDKVRDFLSKYSTEDEQIAALKQQGETGEIGVLHYVLDAGLNSIIPEKEATKTDAPAVKKEEEKVYDVKANKRNPWIDLGNQALKYFRPSDAMDLDPQELYGELYGLSNNQVDPVQAQFYRPELDVPYDISLQDQINEVTAGSRAAQRMVGYNPAAQAEIAAQAYEPINKIKGEQFRLNQAKKDQVYSGNRATLNDAQFKNLGIADTQYNRQETAKSNTKEINQAALNSISSKYLQNKLENRTLKTYENMYNYRFGKDFVADNYNGVFQANMPNVYDKGSKTANMVPVYNSKGDLVKFQQLEDETEDDDNGLTAIDTKKSRSGSSIKAKNGSIVSAYKRL